MWPLSRKQNPKQLLNLGLSDFSLVQQGYARLGRTVNSGRIHIVTGANHTSQVLAQITQLDKGFTEGNILAEPFGRDSAPAILWGALALARENPEAVAAVVWSDQMIKNEDRFDQCLNRAYEAVKDGGLAAIGVTPTHPATTYGYIQFDKGKSANGDNEGNQADGAYPALKFIEKPNLQQAEHLLAEGNTVWNAGIFVFKVRTLLEEFQTLAPALYQAFASACAGNDPSSADWRDPALVKTAFKQAEPGSIDYLILEKTKRLLIVPGDLGWSDLGSWDEVYRQADKDAHGNALSGDVVTVATKNTLVRGSKRLITTVGVENLVIIDTEDALLVCDMSKVQDIKTLVTTLQGQKRYQTEELESTDRPWGGYTILHESEGCKVKVLEVNARQKLSLQMHRQRAEHWVVVEGTAILTLGNTEHTANANEYFYIPLGEKHRIENRGEETLKIIEVQQGSYLGEDDIVRFEDTYGRN